MYILCDRDWVDVCTCVCVCVCVREYVYVYKYVLITLFFYLAHVKRSEAVLHGDVRSIKIIYYYYYYYFPKSRRAITMTMMVWF